MAGKSKRRDRRLNKAARLENLENRVLLAADLAGNYTALTPDSSIQWGQTVEVENRIRNYGSTSVTWPVYVNYYLSNDTVFGDADDVDLGYYSYEGGIPAYGYSSYFKVNVTLPAIAPAGYGGSGPFYIAIKTDSANEVMESNENNNFGQEGFMSDYYPFTVAATTAAGDPGGTGDVSFVLTWGYDSLDEGPDIDLHVIDPSGVNWDYTKENSAHFDLDDRGATGDGDGAGPERAYWTPAVMGTYQFYAKWYDNGSAATKADATLRVYRKQWNGVQKLVLTRTVTLSGTNRESTHWSYKVSPVPVPPAAPTNLVAKAISTSQINLSWKDVSSIETGYRIERTTAGGSWQQIATVAANVSTYQDASLAAGTTYYYRVRAYNAAGTSSYTQVISASTSMPTQPAATPGGQGELSFVLTWGYDSYDEGPDIDLHVIDPAGVNWDYTRENSAHFDLDDRGATGNGNGAGPERAWWNPAMLGNYKFYAYWYENGSAATRANATIRVYRQQPGGAQKLVDSKSFTLSPTSRQSSTWTYSAAPVATGPLSIVGTSADDVVDLNMVNGLLQVKVNTTTRYYALGTISTIGISTGLGNDRVTIGDGVPAVSINGGAGHDTLTGGNYADTISGGADNDTIYGRLNRDVLKGDAGNDTILGGRGTDTIYGGDGDDSIMGVGADDWLYGGLGNDTIDGGFGIDHIFGDDGDDWLYSRDDMRDSVSGGTGSDRAQVDPMLDSRTTLELLIA